MRKATSRPRLSPASVNTLKCAVWTSFHFGSSPAKTRVESAIPSEQTRTVSIVEERFMARVSAEMLACISASQLFSDRRLLPLNLPRAPAPILPSSLDRLDARAGLSADVPDALLRLLAGRRRAQEHFPDVLTIGRHAARPALSVSRRYFVRARNRQTGPQECECG